MRIQSAKGLLVFEPRIYSDLDKYIWISDSFKVHREAQRFFVCLLKSGIYIKGFATDKKSMFNLKMYNKRIYDINVLDRERSIVFYDSYLERFDVELPDNVYNARMLNPELPRKNIVIWGSGITGRRVFKILSANRIKTECYIDSNKDLEGTYQCGLRVHASKYIEELPEKTTIIEAMEKWEELDAYIGEIHENRFYFSFVEKDKKEEFYNSHYIKNVFNLMCWNSSFAFLVGKKVYVFGIGKIEIQMAEYLKLLDIGFGGFLIDDFDLAHDENYADNDVNRIEDILNERDYIIWTHDLNKVKRFEECGLISHKNYVCYQGGNCISLNRKQILDLNLGNNYLADSKYPGITVYGVDRKKDFKIVALGNSTTDGKLYSFKSWPELMYEELRAKGLEDITVYNGGVYAYTSGQELLKLIRDIIPLEPNMIIVYDGYCDLTMHFSYPLANGYLKTVFEIADKNMEPDEQDGFFAGKNTFVYYGVEAKKDMFELWLSNIRTMSAIAAERNIGFYCFCQPMLSSKEGKTEKEKNMLLSVPSPMITNLIERSFRKRMNQMCEKQPKYIYDLSHIFDDETDVYMDQCHVWEKGNQIIAKEINKIILPELKRFLGLR